MVEQVRGDGSVGRLLDGPDKWIQDAMAVDATGNEVEPGSPFAVGFCMLGALQRSYPDLALRRKLKAAVAQKVKLPGITDPDADDDDIVVWNDRPERTVDDVLALVKEMNL